MTDLFVLGILYQLTIVAGDEAKARQDSFDKLNYDPAFLQAFRNALNRMKPEPFDRVVGRLRA
jgi:hypothetical protein